jgi:hypothetical protein
MPVDIAIIAGKKPMDKMPMGKMPMPKAFGQMTSERTPTGRTADNPQEEAAEQTCDLMCPNCGKTIKLSAEPQIEEAEMGENEMPEESGQGY